MKTNVILDIPFRETSALFKDIASAWPASEQSKQAAERVREAGEQAGA